MFERRLSLLAGGQHGVVSFTQLRQLGLSRQGIQHRVRASRLHPLFPGAFALGHAAIGPHGKLLAATLACGDGTVVSHGTAAELLGLRDSRPESIHVIPPERQSGRKINGIRWHRVPYPDGEEQRAIDSVPCTSPSRTLIDLAGSLGWRSLAAAVERAAILQVLDVTAVFGILERGPRRRGAPKLRLILSDWLGTPSPRLRSELEARFLSVVSRASIPQPQCNQRIRAAGHMLEVDFLWPGQKLVVEVDGRSVHDSEIAFERDRDRDRRLTLAGYTVIRFTWAQVTRRPREVRHTLVRLLDGSGVRMSQDAGPANTGS